MKRIMFVCHGNICRSPSAEIIMRDMIKKAGLEEKVMVSSSATSDEEIHNGIGNPVYPPMAQELRRHGLDCSGKRAVKLKKEDYDKYDLFIGMDSANIRNMNRIFGSDPQSKIRKLMEYTSRGGDVADPWYCGNFDVTFRDVSDGCYELIKIIKETVNS